MRRNGHPVRMADGTVYPTKAAFLRDHPISKHCPGFNLGHTGDEILKWWTDNNKKIHRQTETKLQRRDTYYSLMREISRQKIPENSLYQKQQDLKRKRK